MDVCVCLCTHEMKMCVMKNIILPEALKSDDVFFLWFNSMIVMMMETTTMYTCSVEQTHRPVVYVLVLFYFNCVSCTCVYALAMNIFVSCYVTLCVCVYVCTYTKNVFLYQRVHGAPVVSVRVV